MDKYFLISTLFFATHSFVSPSLSQEINGPEVEVIGAPLTGSFIEAVLGAAAPRHHTQFYSYSSDPIPGFLGPQHFARAPSIREQPGVFPGLKLGADSLIFTFAYEGGDFALIPIVIKPDGTIYKGFAMTPSSATQRIEIHYPAQIGLYTLLVLTPDGSINDALLHVTAATSTHPHRLKRLVLKPLHQSGDGVEKVSSELIYRGNNSSLNFFE